MITALILAIVLVLICVTNCGNTLKPYDKVASKQLQGIYAILIVAAHICNYIDSQDITSPSMLSLTYDVRCFARYVVGGLFFISGYGISVSGGITTFRSLLKREKKVAKPFVVFVLFYQVVLLLTNNFDICRNLACLKTGNTTYLLPNCWFVFVILLFYFLLYVVSQFSNKILRCISLFLLSAITIVCFLALGFGNHWYISILAISFGYIMASYKNLFDRYVVNNKLMLFAFGCISVLTVYFSTRISVGSNIASINNGLYRA